MTCGRCPVQPENIFFGIHSRFHELALKYCTNITWRAILTSIAWLHDPATPYPKRDHHACHNSDTRSTTMVQRSRVRTGSHRRPLPGPIAAPVLPVRIRHHARPLPSPSARPTSRNNFQSDEKLQSRRERCGWHRPVVAIAIQHFRSTQSLAGVGIHPSESGASGTRR